MLPCDGRAICKRENPPITPLEKLLRALAMVTMLMTIPQVVKVWTMPAAAAALSLPSWGAYLVSSVAWLAYGIQKRDATLCIVNTGWVALEAAIVVGIVVGQ